ncbi:MAG: periplasmic Cu(I)/Cu(II)-binding protein CopK [Sterolibacterium sp.]|jgi:hypothetical protein
MFKKILLVAALSTLAASAFAIDSADIQETFELKDGSTVYIFKDGKMAMENKYGRVENMAPGHVMEAKNGQKITMQGDEVARLHSILTLERAGG